MTKKVRATTVSNKMATKILRTVPYNNVFYFFTGIGQYSGKFAVSLADFCEKIKRIDIKWIRTTIGDAYLANTISRIRGQIQGEELRGQIHQTVEMRLTELRKLLASEESYVEHE
jgi:hypothetical protein